MDSVLQKYRVFKNFIFKISFYKLSQFRFMNKPAKQGEPTHKHKPALYLPKNNIRISKLLFFSQAYCHTFCQTVDCFFFFFWKPTNFKDLPNKPHPEPTRTFSVNTLRMYAYALFFVFFAS